MVARLDFPSCVLVPVSAHCLCEAHGTFLPCSQRALDLIPVLVKIITLQSLNTISRHWKDEFGYGMLMGWHVFPPAGWVPAGTAISTVEGQKVPFNWAINTSPAMSIKHQSTGTCLLRKITAYRAPRCSHGPVPASTALPVLSI